LRMGLTHSASSVGPQHEGIIMAPQPWVNQKSIEIDREVGGWGPNQAHMCVCACES